MISIHPKVTAGALAGALTGLIVAELGRRGIQIQADEASDLTVLVSFLAAYLVPTDSSGTLVPVAVQPTEVKPNA